MAEVKTIDLNTKYKDAVILDEYNGTYSLIAGSMGEYRSFWRICKMKTKNGYTDKDMPVKIVLGDANKAIEVLSELLDYLRGGEPAGNSQFSDDVLKDSEAPF